MGPAGQLRDLYICPTSRQRDSSRKAVESHRPRKPSSIVRADYRKPKIHDLPGQVSAVDPM
jgi:hypothetical protein